MGSGYWLLRQMILSVRKGADKNRLTAFPEPLLLSRKHPRAWDGCTQTRQFQAGLIFSGNLCRRPAQILVPILTGIVRNQDNLFLRSSTGEKLVFPHACGRFYDVASPLLIASCGQKLDVNMGHG